MAGILDPKTGLLTQAPEGTTINETGIVNRPITSPTQQTQPVQAIPTPNTRSQISETPQAGYIQGYDTNQNYKPVYVPKGVYVPGISPTPKEMTTNSLQNSGTIKLPNVDLSGVSGKSDPSGALTAAEQFQADYKSYQEKLKSLQTAEQQKATSLDTKIVSLIGDTAGMSAFESQQRSLLEDPLNKQLTSVNNQITALMAEKERLRIDQEGKPITLSSITGSVAQNNAKLNGEILTLTAQASALQGNIALAEQQVTQAVNAKYGPALEALRIAQAQRDSLTGTLTKQEAEQKAFLDIQSKKEEQNIADKKEKEKAIQDTMLSYIKAGGTNANIMQQISSSSSYENALQILAENAPPQTEIVDLGNRKVLINSITGKAIKDLGAIGKINKTEDITINTQETGALTDFNILAEAVSNKLGSVASKSSFQKQYNQAKTDEERLKILAANVVLPPDVRNGIIQNTQVTRSLNNVIGMLDKGIQTGLLQAGQSYIANKLGTGADKEVENIKSKLITAIQPYRNKVTGAAWGTQEEAEYQALIGSVKFSPEDLRNKLNVFKQSLVSQSQSAIMAGIDPLGSINENSVLSKQPALVEPMINSTPAFSTPQQGFWSKVGNFLFGND